MTEVTDSERGFLEGLEGRVVRRADGTPDFAGLTSEEINAAASIAAKVKRERALAALSPAERAAFDRLAAKAPRTDCGRWDLSEMPDAERDLFDALIRKVWPARPEEVRVLPPPHERRAAVHRARYRGEAVPFPEWSVKARLKPLDKAGLRYRVICGYGPPCPGCVGEMSRPDGIEPHWPGHATSLLERETYGPRGDGNRSPWIISAPPGFPGYEPLPDGSFRSMPKKRGRAPDGRIVARRLGRREAPSVLYSGGMENGTITMGRGLRGIVGWWARPPAVIECPHCRRKNLVEEPSPD